MDNGWESSSDAWIKVIGRDGDWGRKHVLDAPMIARVAGRGFRHALDLGCGEGRFCRMLAALGIKATGIDPTKSLIERARALDPSGDYRIERAEQLSHSDGSVDLVVAYLSLIDIPDLSAAFSEVHRVLRPSGSFLIANLQSFNTASINDGWGRDVFGRRRFCIDNYLMERPVVTAWRGIKVTNWHRPAKAYVQGLLHEGFELCHFDEPEPHGVEDAKADRYRRVPNFVIMEWRKK